MSSNQLVAEVTINDVEHDLARGWFRVKTDKGRFDTKIPEKAQEALSLRGKTVRIFYTEQPSQNVNPHTGQPYAPNRYYERADEVLPSQIGDGFAMPQTPSQFTQPQAPQPTHVPPQFSTPTAAGEDPRRAWRILLQTGAKLAVETMPLMPNEQRSFDVQKQIAMAWAKWFWVTPPPATDSMGDDPPTPQRAYDEQPIPAIAGTGYATPPDPDIPF